MTYSLKAKNRCYSIITDNSHCEPIFVSHFISMRMLLRLNQKCVYFVLLISVGMMSLFSFFSSRSLKNRRKWVEKRQNVVQTKQQEGLRKRRMHFFFFSQVIINWKERERRVKSDFSTCFIQILLLLIRNQIHYFQFGTKNYFHYYTNVFLNELISQTCVTRTCVI